jgi:Na+/citrate or Na+/malate symporter
MATDTQIALAFIVVFLIFIMDCKQFFVLFILSLVVGLIGAYIDSYFLIPAAIRYWIILVFAMISIFGISKAIHLANKSYKKGKLQIEELN